MIPSQVVWLLLNLKKHLNFLEKHTILLHQSRLSFFYPMSFPNDLSQNAGIGLELKEFYYRLQFSGYFYNQSDFLYDMSRFCQFLYSLASLTPYKTHHYCTRYQCMCKEMTFLVIYIELPSIQAHPRHSRSIFLEMIQDRRGTVLIKATEINVFLKNWMFFAH